MRLDGARRMRLDGGLGSKLHGVPFCVGGPLSPQTAGARKYLEGVSKATDGL